MVMRKGGLLYLKKEDVSRETFFSDVRIWGNVRYKIAKQSINK